MSRTPYACPECGTRLAWKRASGAFALAPGVVAGTRPGSVLVGLLCPQCSRLVRVPGVAIRLEPWSLLDRMVNDADNPAPG